MQRATKEMTALTFIGKEYGNSSLQMGMTNEQTGETVVILGLGRA
jgi:hypothetical protein